MSRVAQSALLAPFLIASVLLGAPHPAQAQMAESVLSPSGRLRIEVAPTFHLWERRFGEDGSEPLGFDLENQPLVPVADLQQLLRSALADPSLTLVLGSARAEVTRERSRVNLGLALGVFDWLTIGANVPLVSARTEVAFDFRALPGTNLGPNPFFFGDGSAAAFLGTLDSSRGALQQRVAQSCPNGAASGASCPGLVDLLARYTTFAGGLATAYGVSPVFVTAGSPAGGALQQRMNGFRTEIQAKAPGVATPGAAPLAAAPVTQTSVRQGLTDPAAGLFLVSPFENTATGWRVGDVELSAALRALHGEVRDSARAPARIRYQAGGQALVRLPTGTVDHPDVPLDLGTGDGQLDVELSAFADVRVGRVGLHAEAGYGVQRPTDVVRRVAPPEMMMAPFYTRVPTRWTPGSYRQFDLAPRWHLTDAFAIGALYRFYHKDRDSYELLQAVPSPFSAADLERETAETAQEIGAGLAFSTLGSWEEGRTSFPFEARVSVRKAVAGSGGMNPDGLRMEATARLFWRIWGAEPTPAGAR